MTRHDFANLRRSHGSQRAVAQRIGVGFRTLQRLESGTIANDEGNVPDKYKHMILGLARKGGEA